MNNRNFQVDEIRKCGFSLLEILLSLSLFLLFLIAVIFSFSTLDRNAKILESVFQIEGLIKYTKANSANTGRNFRLNLSGSITNRISWEAEPFSNPGYYTTISGGWTELSFSDFVDIESENTNKIQIFPNGELSDVNLLITSKEDENIRYKISVDGKLGIIRHERIEAENNVNKD